MLSSVSTDGSAALWRPGPSYAPWSSSPLCLSVLSSRQRQPLLQPKSQPAPQSITPQKEQKLPWASLLVGTDMQGVITRARTKNHVHSRRQLLDSGGAHDEAKAGTGPPFKESTSVKKLRGALCVMWQPGWEGSLGTRQEYWSGEPFLSPGDLPNPGIEPRFPALQAYSLPAEPPRKPPKFLFNMN